MINDFNIISDKLPIKANKDPNLYPVGTVFLTNTEDKKWIKIGEKYFSNKDRTIYDTSVNVDWNGYVILPKSPDFLQSCVLKRNSKEIRDKLEELGWKPFGYMENPYIACDKISKEFETVDDQGLINIYKCDEEDEVIYIDSNVSLFLNIAALRSDSDYKQYFVNEQEIVINPRLNQYIKENSMNYCLVDKYEALMPNITYHKASVHDLIKDEVEIRKYITKNNFIKWI